MQRKVAFFLPSLDIGGVERMMLNLAEGFLDKGLMVDLILAKAEGPYVSQIPFGVRVVNLGASRVLASIPALVRYLRRERPTALLSAKDYVNVVALWSRKLAGVSTRMVVSVRINPILDAQNAKNIRERVIPFLMRTFYPQADAVVTVSQGVADDLVRLTGLSRDKVCVIYNPTVTPELFAKSEEPLEHPWFAPGEPPVVLGVGRLAVQKDFATLIRAFAIVRNKRPARLMILGEGGERPKLESLIQELRLGGEVCLPGFEAENPYKYMKRAAVFVLSSRWEGLPNVLIQALALGTPVVSTDCPSGPAEILEDGKWGELVPVGDAEAMAAAILRRVEQRDEAFKQRVLERTREFSLDQAVDRYLALLLGGPEQ